MDDESEVESVEIVMELNRSIVQCTKADLVLLLVPPSGLHLAGAFRFQCLFGGVSVGGFTQEGDHFDESRFIPYAVHNKAQVPLLFVPSTEEPISTDSALLRDRIRPFLEQDTCEFAYASSFCAVLLVDVGLKIVTQFLSERFGNFIKPLERFNAEHIAGNLHVVKGVKVDERLEKLPPYFVDAEAIHKEMDYATANGGILMVTGCKGAGKSTMNRYICNRFLSQGKEVFFLDTDVGQAEFTPPGCISLVRVDEAILTPPFLHQKAPVFSLCLGTIQPGNYFPLYMDCVFRVFQKYAELRTANSVLVVNSHGWVEGLGQQIMARILQGVQPSTVINLQTGTDLGFDIPLLRAEQHSVNYKVQARINEQTSRDITPKVLREFNITGYFANCLEDERFGLPSIERTLASLFAYQVGFDKISLFFNRDRPPVKDNFVFSSLNCAVVALCAFGGEEETARLKTRNVCNNAQLPRVVACTDERNQVAFQCFGYGLIRAISLEQRLFYVITPIAPELCRKTQLFVLPHGIYTPPFVFDRDDTRSAPYLAQTRTLEEYNELVRDQNRVINALQTKLHNSTGFRANQRVVATTKRHNPGGAQSEPPAKK
ncbi:Polynucleotide 5'-hydroxyl-kinase nol-9 [Aphelenchoides fujianensis]|nr:Polynucleotide 5'-hydroxyl-kinase nol-9 [Aphelenchoides fujianensis]